MIELRNISHSFGDRKIFDRFSLSLYKGEKVVIKGRSGTGKSTLLNFIMGFLMPDEGSVKINGEELNRESISGIRKLMVWLPQGALIAGDGTVTDAIMHPFSFAGNKSIKPEKNTIIEEGMKLGLGKGIIESRFEELSGGEKQRVGLLICKLLKRPLMLLDEPTSALDKQSVELSAEYLLGDRQATVLSTSHDELWLDSCDRVVELGGGNF